LCAMLLSLSAAQASDVFLSAARQGAYRPALDALTVAILDHGYTPVKIQPVDEGLRRKGYPSSDYKLMFFGDKAQVDKVLAVYPEAAVLLPLKVIIYRQGDAVIATTPRLEMWKEVFHNDALDQLIDVWQNDLIAILQEFSSQ
jgi:uncharacterized protein (DUF302 family)